MIINSRITASQHLNGDIAPKVKFYPDGVCGSPYGTVDIDGLVMFVDTPGQAQALADAFADLADHFGTDPVRTYVIRRARETLADYHQWHGEPVTGGEDDGHPRQYRYAEFAGRFATLLDELTDTPDAPTTDTPGE